MDKKLIDRICREGKQDELEAEIRRLRKANEEEHKRVNMRAQLAKQGHDAEKIERMMSRRFSGEVKVAPIHQRPDAEARKALKKRMRSRRR